MFFMAVFNDTIAHFFRSLFYMIVEQPTATTRLAILYFFSDQCIKYRISIPGLSGQSCYYYHHTSQISMIFQAAVRKLIKSI